MFVLSAPRSGSTLLRVIMNSHSQIHAPHETHLTRITVNVPLGPVSGAMSLLGHTTHDLEHLLWDRILHHELEHSGKQVLVVKDPGNALVWERVAACWADARFVFLLRHPAAIVQSWVEARKHPLDMAVKGMLHFMHAVEQARQHLPGMTVRYENLTADPAAQARRICDFLGVAFEPSMLAYSQHEHGPFVPGLGDWRDKIRTGMVQPGRPIPAPEEIPEQLRDMCAAWSYQ